LSAYINSAACSCGTRWLVPTTILLVLPSTERLQVVVVPFTLVLYVVVLFEELEVPFN